MTPLERSQAPVSLRFGDRDLERTFQVEAGRRFRRQSELSLALGGGLWAIAAVFLPILYPQIPASTVQLVIAAVIAGLLGGLVLVGRLATWRAQQVVAAVENLVGGLAMIVIAGYLADLPELLTPALLLNAIFAFIGTRTGFLVATAGALPTTVVFATLVLGGQLPDLGPFHVFLQAAGLVVAGIGAYLLEASTRAAFLQRRVIARQAEAIEREKDISERLLRNMLPEAIAHRLRSGEARIADGLAQVSVLFADLVGSTVLMAGLTPAAAVELLDELFSRFDGLAERHGLEKVKTVGDGYMAAAGAPLPVDDHAARAVAMGLEMIVACADLAAERQQPLSLRVGIHSGPVVAGVIGRAKYSYDLWGDTVNTASRMESHGVPGRVQISEATAALLPAATGLEPRGTIEVKGKGQMRVFLVEPGAGPLAAASGQPPTLGS